MEQYSVEEVCAHMASTYRMQNLDSANTVTGGFVTLVWPDCYRRFPGLFRHVFLPEIKETVQSGVQSAIAGVLDRQPSF
jgi:hypothetical protein